MIDRLEGIVREYEYCLEQVKRLEPEFLAIRAGLTVRQRNLLDAYITACEALSEAERALMDEGKGDG